MALKLCRGATRFRCFGSNGRLAGRSLLPAHWRPNKSFKPKPLRGFGNPCRNCGRVGSLPFTLRFGLIPALGHMRTLLAILLVMLCGCASRISLTGGDSTSAVLSAGTCDSGAPAITLWRVTSRLTGETQEFRLTDPPHSAPVFVKPGSYEIEASCNRGRNECGHLKGWLHLDGAPTISLSVGPGERVQLDCDSATADLVVRR